jgi:hypothetical protein
LLHWVVYLPVVVTVLHHLHLLLQFPVEVLLPVEIRIQMDQTAANDPDPRIVTVVMVVTVLMVVLAATGELELPENFRDQVDLLVHLRVVVAVAPRQILEHQWITAVTAPTEK